MAAEGWPKLSVVKLAVVPTTYALPSDATATPFAPSLLAPPQVVCESRVGPEGDPTATPGRSNARLASIIPWITNCFPVAAEIHTSTSFPCPVAQPEKPTVVNQACSATMVLVPPSRRNGQRRRLRNTSLGRCDRDARGARHPVGLDRERGAPRACGDRHRGRNRCHGRVAAGEVHGCVRRRGGRQGDRPLRIIPSGDARRAHCERGQGDAAATADADVVRARLAAPAGAAAERASAAVGDTAAVLALRGAGRRCARQSAGVVRARLAAGGGSGCGRAA